MKNIRFVFLAVFMLVSWGVVEWVQSAARTESHEPVIPLESIPMQLGEWTGEDVEVDDETVQVLRAHSHINRLYTGPDGVEIALHIAAWESGSGSIAPHHPEICYPNAGWTLMERQQMEVEAATGESPMELIQFQRHGDGVITAHWFQSGDYRYTYSDSLRAQWFRLWGQKDRPATLKVLLQIRQPSIERARPKLSELSQLVTEAIAELRDKAKA